MKLSDFNYTLPEHLIAQHPLEDRSQAKLAVVDRNQRQMVHSRFDQLVKFLPPKSLFVLNDSKVIPARLLGTKARSGGKVEIFLLKKLNDGVTYEALLRPLRKIKDGDAIEFEKSKLVAYIVDARRGLVKFNIKHIGPQLAQVGHMPLPPYIKRPDQAQDRQNYQTVYARKEGSVAAPTAGLHFTMEHMAALKQAGHEFVKVTLHVNYATFQLVEVEDIRQHKMHKESYEVTAQTYKKIITSRDQGRKIIAVGTTSCRVLETIARTRQLKGETNIFLYPGCEFQWTDGLITNFHLPCSSLFMLVSAFAGMEWMREVYQTAIVKKYRFFSYGDAMLIS